MKLLELLTEYYRVPHFLKYDQWESPEQFIDNELLNRYISKSEIGTPWFKFNRQILINLSKHYTLKELASIWESISVWESNQYGRMNNSLRNGKVPARAQRIDRYIAHGPKSKQDTVYRGLSGDVYKTLKPGKTFVDKGYSAASLDRVVAEFFAKRRTAGGVMEITGAANLAVRLPARDPDEGDDEEVLFPRGTKFQIVDIEPETRTVHVKATK